MPAPRWSRAFFGSAASASRNPSAAARAWPALSASHAARSISAARGSICAPSAAQQQKWREQEQAGHVHMLILQASAMPQPASAPIEDGVLDVLKQVSRRPIEPSLDSDLVADLGFDSLQILEVIAELEDRFDISIPLNDVPATRTVAQVVAQVARLVEDRSTA